MDLSLVKIAIATAVSTIPGLYCFGFCPDQIPEPCFYAGECTIDPNGTMGGRDIAVVKCRVLTSRGDDRTGQSRLDEYLSQSGPNSVRTAIMAANGSPGQQALGGTADYVTIVSIQGYKMYNVGIDQFYGAEITVKVVGS